MGKLGWLRPPKMAACHPSWRTNWRALGKSLISDCRTMGVHHGLMAFPVLDSVAKAKFDGRVLASRAACDIL